ncbi:MAG TPA: methyl-accepting chemotaxis protein [Humisphaera sp.]
MVDANEQPGDAGVDRSGDPAAARAWLAEALRVCRAASGGDLEQRVLRIDCGGDLGELLHAVNDLLDLTDAFVREATAALEHAGRGEFFRRVLPNGMLGSFRRAAASINAATEQMDAKTQALAAAEARRARLADDFAGTLKTVESLTAASRQIEGFSKVIHGIASQTNLLALNATIEAARVGAAGAGFAVVADEVKRLARQTGDATKQIEQQVAAIHRAGQATAASVELVRRSLAGDAGGTAPPAEARQAA